MTDNKAIGWGANPPQAAPPGGGSGGAIYTDGDGYNLLIDGTVMHDNTAREGGGGIFFVVNADGGALHDRQFHLSGQSQRRLPERPRHLRRGQLGRHPAGRERLLGQLSPLRKYLVNSVNVGGMAFSRG